jgi:acetyl esterase/lipase
MKHISYYTVSVFFFFVKIGQVQAQDSSRYSTREVVYGHKDGLALTMVAMQPKGKSNARGIINVVLGNYISSWDWIPSFRERAQVYTNAGYTVFMVMLGSQPRYTIPEQITDLRQAIRFVRYHAADYAINPDHLGITGSSAGGHLSLLAGMLNDTVNTTALYPVDRVSSRVQAVACFFPPTDFLNYGKANPTQTLNTDLLVRAGVAAAFDFKIWNAAQQRFVPVSDTAEKRRIVRQISPVYAVSPDDPPTLMYHGDADVLVPLQQSQEMLEKLQQAKVPCKLLVKKGGGHGWLGLADDSKQFVAWFDKYLF